MPEFSRQVLLIAGTDAAGIGRLPRLFADAGFRVHLLGSNCLSASKSCFLASRIECPRGPESTARAARQHLEIHRNEYDSIILADEPTLWAALDQDSQAWLEGWFPVPLTVPALDRLRSKVRFLSDSHAAGLATPRFEICATESELRAAIASIGLPIFVKTARGLAGSGLFFVRRAAELDSQIAKMTFSEPVLVQEEIEGDTRSIAALFDRGRPICWFAYLMRCTWPDRFSSASRIELFSDSQAESLVHGVGALTEFTGLAGIDCMWDSAHSRLLLLEFNPRPTPVYHLGPLAGVDFSDALRTSSSSIQRPNHATTSINLFPQSLYYAAEHMRPMHFIRSLRDAPWDEPALTITHLRRFLTYYVPAPLKRLAVRGAGNRLARTPAR